jgi:serine/threonine-protein kinase
VRVKLGRYTLIRELGQGGMATAFLAEAPGGMKVVLKTPHITDEEVNDRLRDEARTGIRLAHPAVVETLDLFEHKGKPVLVVAFIDGVSVDELRRRGAVEPAGVARIGWQIAQGLHAVHTCTDETGRPLHMVHRDVTAPNVLIDKQGDARLIDLGIARSVENIAATEPGTIKGTVRYLSPELLQGMAPTPQSDLWGLGCVLFEAVTGRPIYTGAPAQTMIAILREPPMTKPQMQELPAPLQHVFSLVFEPDHSKRISDGYDLAIELQKAEAELSDGMGAQDSLALAIIEAVAEKPEIEAKPPTHFGVGEDEAQEQPSQPPQAAPPSQPPTPASPTPTAHLTAAGTHSQPNPIAPGPTSPPGGSGPFGVGTPVTGTPAHGAQTPFNQPKPGTIASGAFPAAPGMATSSPPPQMSNPGMPAQPDPFGAGATPSSGLFQNPSSGPGAPAPGGPPLGGAAPSQPPASAFAPPPPAPSPNLAGAPNPLAAADKLELGARDAGARRLRVGSATNSLARERAAAGPSPFAGLASKFIRFVIIALVLGAAWRFGVQPWMKKQAEAEEPKRPTLNSEAIDGPSYEEIEKQELLEKQRARIKNLPPCWKGDEGFKFVYTVGRKNVVVDKITKVPVKKRDKARCVIGGK